MDARFQPPNDKPKINFEKSEERNIYPDIKDYDKDNKRMAAEMEELKKTFISKAEVHKWIVGLVGAFGVGVLYFAYSLGEGSAKQIAKDNTQDEKIASSTTTVANFITTSEATQKENQNLWFTYGNRITILETKIQK